MGTNTLTFPSTTETKNLKRPRELSIAIVDARPAKRNCRLAVGSLSVPKNNTSAYREELSRHLFYTYCPSDKTNIQRAMKEHYLERVVYGMCGNTVVEKLVLDGETRIPWQVPRVTLEYGRIHYKADERGPMLGSQGYEGMLVSPSSLPGVNEMSRMEYEMAVDAGDSRVATEGKHLFEFCQDMGLGWLEYEDR